MSTPTPVTVVIALGSNLGDRAANLRAAIGGQPGEGIAVQRCSAVWETAPVPADQPAFLNAALLGETALEPEAVLAVLKRLEHRAGRRPNRHWGPRPLDLDLLFYGEQRVETPALTVPHPRIAERGFVLAPLSEIWRGPLPVLGRSALELLDETGLEGLTRTAVRLSC